MVKAKFSHKEKNILKISWLNSMPTKVFKPIGQVGLTFTNMCAGVADFTQ